MALEVDAEIQERAVQYSLVYEEEADEQSSNPPVPIEERVDRLELGMSEPDVNERRQLRIVEESLEVAERLLHLVDRRRHERRPVQRRVLRADPVLETSLGGSGG